MLNEYPTIDENATLRNRVTQLSQRTKGIVHRELEDKNMQLQRSIEHDYMNMDAIAALSDQVTILRREIEILKKRGMPN